jgi:pilus assembly protein CpaE
MESVIKFKDVREILGIENLIYISNNFKIVSKSLNIGIPFVINKPKEKITNEITNLVYEITEYKRSHKRGRRRKRRSTGFFKKSK